jgi:hypothetical protein
VPGGSELYDTGTHVKNEASRETDSDTLSGSETLWRRLSHQARHSFKLYGSVSRLALGQPRWIAASAVLGTLSLGLVGAGIAALVAPYDGVATASLTADRAPRVIAWTGATPS